MKKLTLTRIVSLLLVLSMLFACSCGIADIDTDSDTDTQIGQKIENNTNSNLENNPAIPVDKEQQVIATPEKGTYNEGIVLVKCENEMNYDALANVSYKSVTPLYSGSKWYSVELNDKSQTENVVNDLVALKAFEKVDYDYIMGSTGPLEDKKPTDNPNYDNQVNLGLSNIPHGWTVNGKHPGGSPDVVVAVIDTGVDYNHLDLRNNIWINSAEIPDNGRDDDGNGYIDDIYGWNCVGNNNNPIDDNGHGTHVAGIIAAENNKIGGIGVAYGSKIMVLKAGNSSGYFNNSDIAEAIQYAYMNGASVINMSFGGSQISIAVEEALENAYNSCVLVAAAGNDGACNNLACKACEVKKVSYPAALPYVIGVMSTEKDGKHASSFSNYDHYPYDAIEYEVYAVGEGVGSTWPSNEYACLNGTSMAAPTVAGIAALLRSYYTDREVYSTKFIQSQIVNTGTVNPHILDHVTDEAHSVADANEALTKLPKPAVNLYGYYIDDSVSISDKNNGNGVIDAGETVRLYISLHNRGGVATDVNVTIDTDRGMGLVDPYFTFVNTTMHLSDIGTYSVRESGENYFEIIVASDCPNDYLTDFNIRFTYKNGLDENDKTVYEDDGRQKVQFNVSRGFHLPATITEDTVYKADRLYIVGDDVVIPQGVTVTFEEGCEIQFYDDADYYRSPEIKNYGTLYILGNKDNEIQVFPSQKHQDFVCKINTYEGGTTTLDYVHGINLSVSDSKYDTYNYVKQTLSSISNSCFVEKVIKCYESGSSRGTNTRIWADSITNTSINSITCNLRGAKIESCLIVINKGYFELQQGRDIYGDFINNIIVTRSIQRLDFSGYNNVSNNLFYGDSLESLSTISFSSSITKFKNNTFSEMYQKYASQVINGYYNSSGKPNVDVYSSLADVSLLWPYAVSIELFNADGEQITTIDKEEVKVRVTFNRPMDITKDTYLTFGTKEPYADYKINGEYISETVWEGTYTLKAQVENGQNFLKVNNACAAEDPTKTVFGEYQLHEFTIDTTEAMSMNLQAIGKENGIELTLAQDDYDTLLGYNIYRANSKNGNYVKLNPAIILSTENTFLDENVEPGKTYWYTYKVVLTDFTESNPAGRVSATALDTMAPSVYHTPVNQGYENNNLVISCTASDNVAISTVTLYYRTVGNTEWKALTMSKHSDKYSATIFGSELSLEGLEYYIIASDGRNQIAKGSSDVPYTVIIKEASTISQIGDVDGDGTVTTKDALMLIQCLNEDIILTDDEFKRADLNSDGKLSSVEALRILQYINGNVTTLKMN